MAVYNGALYSGEKLISDCDLVKEGGNNITRMYVGEYLIYPSKTYSSLLQYSGSSPTDICRQVNPPSSNLYWVDCSTLDVGDYVWSNPTKTVFIENGFYGSGNGSSNFYYIIDGVVSSIGTCPPVYTYHRYEYGWTGFGSSTNCFLNQSTVTLVYSYIFRPNGFYQVFDGSNFQRYYILGVPHSTRTINIDNYTYLNNEQFCTIVNEDPHWISLLDNNQITKKTCYNGVLNNVSIDDNKYSGTYGKYLLSNGIILNTQPIFSVGPCNTSGSTPTPTPTSVGPTPTPTPTSNGPTPTPTSIQYYLLENCANSNDQQRSIMNVSLATETVVKLSNGNGICYKIIGTSTLETADTISTYYSDCNSCRGITPTPTPPPPTYYYDLFRCDNSGGDRAKMDGFSNLANGTVVKASDGQCYTITGTSTTITSNTINSTHYDCNSCREIIPPTPTPTSVGCGEYQFNKYICEGCIKKIEQKRQFCNEYRIIQFEEGTTPCPQPVINISVCFNGVNDGDELFTVNVTKSNQTEPLTGDMFSLYYRNSDNSITLINNATGVVYNGFNTPIYLTNPYMGTNIFAMVATPCDVVHSNTVYLNYDLPSCQ
jgi:hypothetical protein